ncbi:MAG: glycosyltransferase family 39 protein [Solirubrobacteraceae bacterium]
MTVPELLEVPPAGRVDRSTQSRESAGPLTAAAAAIALLMIVGAVLRFLVARQSLFADELSTYWIVANHGLGGVISLLNGTYPGIQHAEITPPLFFVASWISAQVGHSPELVRAPSLIAGILTIPAVYLLGVRTVGRAAGLLAASFTALSPFMIYYSSEARSYAVMMLLATLSTLAMLRALDTGKARWWVAYAVCSCAAFYTHYTCAFYLLAQFLWLVWAHREAVRPALIANAGAVLVLAPWAHGLINDLNSPTEKILSALSPFTFSAVRLSLEHWALGFPYVDAGGLRSLPGTPALILLGLAAIVCAIGLGRRALHIRANGRSPRLPEGVVLILLLALAVPIGEAIISAVSTHLFGVRNLAASWLLLALCCAALVIAAGPRLRYGAAVLAVVAFALGAAKMLTVHFARPAFQAAASVIRNSARPGDVILDGTAYLSPGPLSALDVALNTRIPVIRVFAPAEHAHPFGVFDGVTSPEQGVARALAATRGGRLIVVAFPNLVAELTPLLSARYHLVENRLYAEFIPLQLEVWAVGRSTGA